MNTLKISIFKYRIAGKISELSGEQRHQIVSLLASDLPKKQLTIKLLFVLLKLKERFFLRVLIWLFVSDEDLYTCEQFTAFLFQTDSILLKTTELIYPKSLTFIEFIRIDEVLDVLRKEKRLEFKEEEANKIIYIAYKFAGEKYSDNIDKHKINYIESLNINIKQALLIRILADVENLLKMLPKSEATAESSPANWFQILRTIAGTPLNFDSVAELDAGKVIFDLRERILEIQRQKEELERQKNNNQQ